MPQMLSVSAVREIQGSLLCCLINVHLGPGSKSLLFQLQQCLPGQEAGLVGGGFVLYHQR